MIYVAQIKDETVYAVIVEGDKYKPSENEVIVGKENSIGIGYRYEDGKFLPPEVIEDAIE